MARRRRRTGGPSRLFVAALWITLLGTAAGGPTRAMALSVSFTNGAYDAPNGCGTVPVVVSFAGVATGGSAPYTYRWDFGDGSSTVAGPSVVHSFAEYGTYRVNLSVTDSGGGTAWTDRNVSLYPPPCATRSAEGPSLSAGVVLVGLLTGGAIAVVVVVLGFDRRRRGR